MCRFTVADSWVHLKDLYGVYGTLLGFLPSRFDPEKTVFRVTNNIITSQVAGAVISGIFGTSDEIPVLQQSDSIDSLRPGYACDYANKLRAGYQGAAPNWTEHLTKSQKLFARLDAISGVDPGNNPWHSYISLSPVLYRYSCTNRRIAGGTTTLITSPRAPATNSPSHAPWPTVQRASPPPMQTPSFAWDNTSTRTYTVARRNHSTMRARNTVCLPMS